MNTTKLNIYNWQEYKDYFILKPVGRLGETFVTAILTRSFKEQFGGKVIFLTTNPVEYEFLQSFQSIDKVLLYDIYDEEYLLKCLSNNNTIVDINIYRETPYLSTNMIERTAQFLNLTTINDFEKPFIPEEQRLSAQDTFKQLNLKEENTIFLSPFANSCNYTCLSEQFWNNLAKEICNQGYNVVFNSPDNCFSEYQSVYLPINQTIAFVNMCKQAIMFRSGLVDILAGSSSVPISVLYPNSNKQFAIGFNDNDLINITKKYYKYNDKIDISNNFINLDLLKIISAPNQVNQIIFDGNENNLFKTLISSIINS